MPCPLGTLKASETSLMFWRHIFPNASFCALPVIVKNMNEVSYMHVFQLLSDTIILDFYPRSSVPVYN